MDEIDIKKNLHFYKHAVDHAAFQFFILPYMHLL